MLLGNHISRGELPGPAIIVGGLFILLGGAVMTFWEWGRAFGVFMEPGVNFYAVAISRRLGSSGFLMGCGAILARRRRERRGREIASWH